MTSGVDVEPKYPGGIEKFFAYIKDSLNTTAITISTKKIYVNFVVEKDGSLSDIKILRGINEELDQKVIKIIKQCPNWESGELYGKEVRTSLSLPITFE